MEFRTIRALGGPNLWADRPVLEVWVDLLDPDHTPSDRWPGLRERLISWLPALAEPRADPGPYDRSGEELGVGLALAHVLARSTVEFQGLAGTPVSFCRATGTTEAGVYQLAIEHEDEVLARACLETARSLCLGAA